MKYILLVVHLLILRTNLKAGVHAAFTWGCCQRVAVGGHRLDRGGGFVVHWRNTILGAGHIIANCSLFITAEYLMSINALFLLRPDTRKWFELGQPYSEEEWEYSDSPNGILLPNETIAISEWTRNSDGILVVTAESRDAFALRPLLRDYFNITGSWNDKGDGYFTPKYNPRSSHCLIDKVEHLEAYFSGAFDLDGIPSNAEVLMEFKGTTTDPTVVVMSHINYGNGALLLLGTFFPIFEGTPPDRYYHDNFLDNILIWVENPDDDCIPPDEVPTAEPGVTDWGCYQRTSPTDLFSTSPDFSYLRDDISSAQQNVFNCSFYISADYLNAIDVFITSEPSHMFSYGDLTQQELDNLYNWVYYDGGTLIITMDSVSYTHRAIYTQFTSQFGIEPQACVGAPGGFHNTTNDSNITHCLTSGIDQLDMYKFCSFTVSNQDAVTLLRRGEDEVSMSVTDNFGSGAVLAVGGIQYPFDDDAFRQNLILWSKNTNADCIPEPTTTRPPTLVPVPTPTLPPVPHITTSPIPVPTPAPTTYPTPNSTHQPTANPSPNFTDLPTFQPTPNMTPQPTPNVTPLPTSQPTPSLTSNPTPQPTPYRTPEPYTNTIPLPMTSSVFYPHPTPTNFPQPPTSTTQPTPQTTPNTSNTTPLPSLNPTILNQPYPVPSPQLHISPVPSPVQTGDSNHTYITFEGFNIQIPQVWSYNASYNAWEFMVELWTRPKLLRSSYLLRSENEDAKTGYGLLLKEWTIGDKNNDDDGSGGNFFWACEVLDGEKAFRVFSSQPAEVDVLVHILCYYNSSQLVLYVNAEYQNSIDANLSTNTDTNLQIGPNYNGSIVYLIIYNITNIQITDNTVINNYNDFNCSMYEFCEGLQPSPPTSEPSKSPHGGSFGGCLDTDGNHCSPLDPFNTYYAIAFGVLIFTLTLVALCISHKRNKHKALVIHGSILVAGFSVLDFAADISFTMQLTNEGSHLAKYGWSFLFISIALNIIFILKILRNEFKTLKTTKWFNNHVTSASVVAIISISNCDVMQLLYSRVHPALDAPIGHQTKKRLVIYALVGHIIEDIPLWILQLIAVQSEPSTIIPFFSLIISTISIVFGIAKRLLSLISRKMLKKQTASLQKSSVVYVLEVPVIDNELEDSIDGDFKDTIEVSHENPDANPEHSKQFVRGNYNSVKESIVHTYESSCTSGDFPSSSVRVNYDSVKESTVHTYESSRTRTDGSEQSGRGVDGSEVVSHEAANGDEIEMVVVV